MTTTRQGQSQGYAPTSVNTEGEVNELRKVKNELHEVGNELHEVGNELRKVGNELIKVIKQYELRVKMPFGMEFW